MIERSTIISKNVLAILQSAKKPLSVKQLLDELEKQNLKPNKTTIYRLLSKLVTSHTVQELSFQNDTKYYEMKQNHHHHFYCTNCQAIHCLSGCSIQALKSTFSDQLPNNDFVITSHDFNLYGLCDTCTRRSETT